MQTGELEIYEAIRSEIVTNHVLIHVTTWIVVLMLLVGTWIVEKRKTILSVILPLLSLSWAAAMVRFDFFIHRQGAYLRLLEARMQEQGISIPLYESWKYSLQSTKFVVPITDLIAIWIITVPTLYLLSGPLQEYFLQNQWRGGKLYAWGVASLFVILLASLAFIPKIAAK